MSKVQLDYGNGGQEMQSFLQQFLPKFHRGNDWSNFDNDAATLPLPDGKTLCFTTDSFVVNPLEFPGGNIGDLAFAGTVNDLVVMGADPLGLSCSLIIEEGFSEETLSKILDTMATLSKKYQIPIVTGDTKVMEKGAVDGIVINTSGVGMADSILDMPLEVGDQVIISGGIGEHGVALLSQRFDFETAIISDSKPLVEEMKAIRSLLKFAKDPTRGGLSASLNEMAISNKCNINVYDEEIPMQKAVRSAGELLGIEIMDLANEGKIVCVASYENAEKVLAKLKKFNPMAAIIGAVSEQKEKGSVVLKTDLGSRLLMMPSGKIVPRIC